MTINALSTSGSPAKPVPKTIECGGTPYDIGLAHGKGAAQQVHHNIKVYRAYFEHRAKLSWSDARQKASAAYIPCLQSIYPEILEEMYGIAKGAGEGLTTEDILTLNVRSELLLTVVSDGCTCLAQKAHDGRVFISQNWDWLEQLHEGIVFLRVKPTGSDIRMHFLTEAGLVGKIGMNSAGVGITLNAITAPVKDQRKLPVHVAMRRVLQYARSFEDAVVILDEFGLASAVNFMLTDSSGRIGDVECSPIGNVVIEPSPSAQGPFVAHTNHLYTEIGDKVSQVPAKHSFSRLQRMKDLTMADGESGVVPSFESIRARLSDKQGWPFSICRGGAETDGPEAMAMHPTVVSGMMELTERKARFVIGRPSEDGSVVEFSL